VNVLVCLQKLDEERLSIVSITLFCDNATVEFLCFCARFWETCICIVCISHTFVAYGNAVTLS